MTNTRIDQMKKSELIAQAIRHFIRDSAFCQQTITDLDVCNFRADLQRMDADGLNYYASTSAWNYTSADEI